MPRGRPTGEAVRAAVTAALLTGESVGEVARRFRLPKQTVSDLRAGIGTATLGQVRTETRERIEALLLECVRADASAVRRIAEAVGSPEYLQQQPARSVAALYREISSTLLRLLEVASAARVEETDAG